MSRRVLIVANPYRPETIEAGEDVARVLADAGIDASTDVASAATQPFEAAIVLGGDGTMLHAARMTHGSGIPLLGINLGRVGFLAELEREDVARAAQRLADGNFTVEERQTLHVTVTHSNGRVEETWALNEAALERADRLRTLEVTLAVDGEPLSSFGCDGVVVSTATGSTAHAFSAGGPVMWPDVDAILCVPLAAHALFARPLVIGPKSSFTIGLVTGSEAAGQLALDGAESIDVAPGSRIDVRRGDTTVKLARMSDAPFTERLVRKFSLPVNGWRGERTYPTPIGSEIHGRTWGAGVLGGQALEPRGPEEDG